MKNLLITICLLAGALSGLSLSLGAAGRSAAEPASKTSAFRFLDLNRVIDQCTAFKAEKEAMKARWKGWSQDLAGLEEEIKTLKSRIDNYAGHRQQSAFGKLVAEYNALRSRAKSLGEWYSTQKVRDEAQALIKWTEVVKSTCAEYARQQGIGAIFHKWTDPEEEVDLEKRYNAILRRASLYDDPALDITDEILARLSK